MRDRSSHSEMLAEIANDARSNSERWFPMIHAEDAVVPLAIFYSIGLGGEAGEVLNDVKKIFCRRDGNSEELVTGLGYELADVFIYLLLLADELGVDLYESYLTKRALNEERWGVAR